MAYLLRFLMMSSVVLMLKCAVASGDREGGTIGAPDDEKGHSQEYIVVTEFRGCVLLLVCIAILAVDFDLFPYEMVKTDRQGYSLMDLGVGTFIIANALVAPQTQETHKSSWKLILSDVGDTAVLVILGVSRFVSAYLTEYHVSESEYGKHWNFFCSLAFVKIFGRLLAAVFHPLVLPYVGLLIGCLYEAILQFGLYDFVLDSPSSKTFDSAVLQFLFDNRSGLSSSVGFLAMFLMWIYVGRLFRTEKRSASDITQLARHLLQRSFFVLLITFVMRVPSRRLANLSYIFWLVSSGISHAHLLCKLVSSIQMHTTDVVVS
ncbi:hypothetical protein RvY_00257-1 [Ramazzottius varieornatus]|uniref:Phosphatidylinositol-glycan biosynthesis class W protein n=1 Tax=Ramazzottius varieornatus TaxID=947166 RepID=A0A1D1UM38_RAMVA|nr:hypothetical protein RvY_00257-1 [Ramazzottius varieornatus]